MFFKDITIRSKDDYALSDRLFDCESLKAVILVMHAENHPACVQAHLLQQHGEVGDEPEDAAVLDGAFRDRCDDEHLHALGFRGRDGRT